MAQLVFDVETIYIIQSVFIKTYEKEVFPQIDELMKKIEMFLKYKDDIEKDL